MATAKPMHGGYHFFDSSGNDVQVWGSSTSLYGIVADATPTQLISSATLSSTWDCADSQGFAYCVNSSRDGLIKTNGATQTWSTAVLGTMVEITPDRLVVAGVSGNANTIYVSQSNTFTNFTTGLNTTDPFTEVIASPGSKLTHLRWGCGKLLWWKDQSFGYMDFDNQYSLQIKTVADNIGTFDNTSAIDPGGNVWFRGQDGHIWKYDCTSLEKMSLDISSNTQASQKRVSNFWTQSSQSDWQAGVSTPSVNFNLSISPGDVVLSSFTVTEAASSAWNLGSASNVTVSASSYTITHDNSGTITDPSFEGTLSTNFASNNAAVAFDTAETAQACTLNPQLGSQFLRVDVGNALNNCNVTYGIKLLDSSGNILDTKSTSATNNSCAWTQETYTNQNYYGYRVKFAFYQAEDNCLGTSRVLVATTTASYLFGGSISYYYSCNATTPGGGGKWCSFDNVSAGSTTITSGSFTSQILDTSISSTVVQAQASWTVNTSTPAFTVYTSSANPGTWTSILTSTGTNATNGTRYLRYVSTFTLDGTTLGLSSVSSVLLVAKSTGGVFASQVKNAPNANAWSTFGANTQSLGGTQTFYIRSSTFAFTTASASPAWTAQNVGGLVAVATGTYFQVRDDFVATSATATLALNDFTVNWFEGSATDQAYMLYFNDSIWASVADGAGQATNNYIFRNDLINDLWTVYNFGAGGMLVQGTNLYFGDTSAGNIYEYGTSTSDNGTAINAYVKSKNFTGADPFMQSQLTQIDTFANKNTGTTLTATYSLDSSTSTSFSVGLSTSSSIAQSRKLLPSGKLGYVWNIQYGDNSTSSAWELFGYRITFSPQPYRPTQ